MNPQIDELLAALRLEFPTSHIRILPEPALFLRSNRGRSYHAEGTQFLSLESALAHVKAYMRGIRERIRESEGFELDEAHPWIIGVHPGDLASDPLIFIFGNLIRPGDERWVELGYPRYEDLQFPS